MLILFNVCENQVGKGFTDNWGTVGPNSLVFPITIL